MKKLLRLFLRAFGAKSTQSPDIKSLETEGNLESPNPCACIELSEVTNKNNPADILHGMGKCIELKDFDKAAKLFAISGVYGTYDTYRVKDETAHQGLMVLQQEILMNIEETDREYLMNSFNKTLEKGSKELAKVCQAIRLIGKPNYFPKYMIQHGLRSFMQNEGNGLVEEFDSKESWELALKSYLHCGE